MITMFFLHLITAAPPPYTPSPAAQFIISQNWAQLLGEIASGILAFIAWRRSFKNGNVVHQNTQTAAQTAELIEQIAEYLESQQNAETASFRRRQEYVVTVPPAPGRRSPSPRPAAPLPPRSRHAASPGVRPQMKNWSSS